MIAPTLADIPIEKATEFTPAAEPARLMELDGLRGLACLLVLLWHYGWELTQHISYDYHIIQVGIRMWWSGVDLFFVLSGFLIGGILWDNRDSANYYVTFYVRRACRIFPLYFAWLFLGVAVASVGPDFIAGKAPVWSYALFVPNVVLALENAWETSPWIGTAWSLGVEEQFYLLLPLLVRATPRHRLVGLLIPLIVLAVLIRLAVLVFLPGQWAIPYFLLPCRMDSLLIGVLAAVVVRNQNIAAVLRNNTACLWAIFFLLGTGVGVFSVRWQYVESPTMIGIGYTWLALFYCCLLLLGYYDPLAKRVLRFRLLLYYGSISYGVYLIHPMILVLTNRILSGWLTGGRFWASVVLLSIAATTLLAWISLHFFEKTFIVLGHKWKYGPSR